MNKWTGLFGLIFILGLIFGGQHLKNSGNSWFPGSGGNFTLQSAQGAVSLDQFQGKVVAIYFGYMSCADICPTSLWQMTSAINLLTPIQAQQVQSLFISLDPDRDSPEAMALFVEGFNKKLIGLTDTKAVLDKVARQYGVIYEKVALENSSMGYVLDHSSVIYLVDKQGQLQIRAPHDTSAEDIKKELVLLIEEKF